MSSATTNTRYTYRLSINHARFQIVLAEKYLPLAAGELRALDALLSVKPQSEPDLSVCGGER